MLFLQGNRDADVAGTCPLLEALAVCATGAGIAVALGGDGWGNDSSRGSMAADLSALTACIMSQEGARWWWCCSQQPSVSAYDKCSSSHNR